MKLKWNFPIIQLLIRQYKKLGLIKFVLWLLFVWLAIKIVIINGFIIFSNFAFGTEWATPPLTSWILEQIGELIGIFKEST